MEDYRKEIKKGDRRLKLASALIIIMTLAVIASSALVYLGLPYTPGERFFTWHVNNTLQRQTSLDVYINDKYILTDEVDFNMDAILYNYPYMTVENLETKVSDEDSSIIEYECDIPSPAYTALCLTVSGVFEDTHDILDTVHIKGTAKIEGRGSKRKIVVDEDNALFYLLFTFKGIPSGILSDDIDAVLQENYITVTSEYLKVIDLPEEDQMEFIAKSVVDLDYLLLAIDSQQPEYIAQYSNESSGYITQNIIIDTPTSEYKLHFIGLGAAAVSLTLLFFLILKRGDLKEKVQKYKKSEKTRLKRDLSSQIHNGKAELDAYQKKEKDTIFIEELTSTDFSDERILKPIMGLVFNPSSNKKIISLLRQIAAHNFDYKTKQSKPASSYDMLVSKKKYNSSPYMCETILGWSMCALSRCITVDAGNKISVKKSQFDSVLKSYRKLARKGKKLLEEYNALIKKYYPNRKTTGNIKIEPWTAAGEAIGKKQKAVNEHYKKMYGGPAGYGLHQKSDFAFESILYIITNHKQQRYSDFMLQSIFVGLFPYMHQHKDSTKMKQYYDALMSMKSSITNWKDYRGFFEVRLSSYCSSYMFANILQEILSCANLTFNYADMHKMVAILTSEIPDIMKLLRKYPLRLIDSSQKDVKGFMKMNAFEHALVTYYTGIQNQGPVSLRYNRVVDQTLPNSAGINIALFADCYSAVPLLFHEFLHFLNHDNEAAVFLATYNFCEYFYRKYSSAASTLFYDYNYTYVYMKSNLKGRDKQEQIGFINDMIHEKYGVTMSIDDAKLSAANKLLYLNVGIAKINKTQMWHKEVPYPLLNKKEEPENSSLAYNAEIRLLTAQKKINEEQYDRYQNQWNTLIKDQAKDTVSNIDYDDLEEYMNKATLNQLKKIRK